MSTKLLNFMAMSWFISTLICLVLEGAFFGGSQQTIINNLTIFQLFTIPGLSFSVPVFNVNFFQSLLAIMTWDYSFYTGSYAFLRWMWLCILTPGMVWGIGATFMYVIGMIISLFRL